MLLISFRLRPKWLHERPTKNKKVAMKIFEIREIPEAELAKRVKDEEENLIHLKFQKATSQLESPIKIRTVRRDIAKMKTVLRERALQKARVTTNEKSNRKS